MPKLKGALSSICFKPFLLKRNYKDVVNYSQIVNGNYVNDISINIDEAKVYNLPLDKIFNNPK